MLCEDAEAWLTLQFLPGLGCARIGRLVERRGSASAVLENRLETAEEFYAAVQRKETVIRVKDLAFAEDTKIELNYNLTLVGDGGKACMIIKISDLSKHKELFE